jgi:hypothetical protein
MKSRLLILLGVTMLITLSFTLVSIHNSETTEQKQEVSAPVTASSSEPVGGFVSEDRF